ncbi:MAG: hypothetical protein Q7Q71_09685 [Verrucomicrobiota bacterium JB023]|nr:hypothetical protein [Verrucomicrobiota bacterium JB023]
MSDEQPQPPGGLKPGGTEGGDGLFMAGGGLTLLGLGLYFFLDSVRVVSGAFGVFSGMVHRGGLGQTTSMGLIFLPFIIGVIILFYDASKRWAWWLSGLGLVMIVIEILSRIRFVLNMKTTHLLLIFVLIAAGAGLIARAYKTTRSSS